MDIKRSLASLVIAGIISLFILMISNDFGITWDETIHMANANQYIAWLEKPDFSNKDSFFRPTVEDVHPPLRKILGGLTHEVLTNRLKIIDNTRGYRISSLFFVIPFIFAFTYLAIGQFGYAVGMLAPFIYSFMPHVLFLTPLLTMDYAIAALWFLAVMSAIKGMKSYKWLTFSALCIGCTMLTKLHGFLLFIPVVGYWLWCHWKIFVNRHTINIKIKVLLKLIYVIFFSFAIYIIGWPWLWTSTISHLGMYFQIQIAHSSVPVYVLGHTYIFAPWWYPLLMFMTTTPAYVLILFFVGMIYVVRKGSVWDRVMLANAAYPILFFSLPGVYRYDWIRLFLASYPFICFTMARGICVVLKYIRPKWRILGIIVFFVLWFITLYISVIQIHPWESAYYNEFVGGIHGAARLGFETEFWGNSYLGVLPWMNAHKTDMMCVTPTTYPFYYYQAMGMIEPGVVFSAGRGACKYVVVLMRQGLFIRDKFIEQVVHTLKPVYTFTVQGVPLIGVYNIENIH